MLSQNLDGCINVLANLLLAFDVLEIKLLHSFGGCDFKNISLDVTVK